MALNYVCSLNYICNLNYVRNLNYVYNLQTQPPRHPHLNRRHLGQGWRNWGPCGRCMAGGAAGKVGMPPPTTSTTLQSIPTYRFSMLLPLHLHSSVVPLAGAPLLPLPPKKVEGGGERGGSAAPSSDDNNNRQGVVWSIRIWAWAQCRKKGLQYSVRRELEMLNLSLLSPGYSRRTNLEDRMVYVLEPVFSLPPLPPYTILLIEDVIDELLLGML